MLNRKAKRRAIERLEDAVSDYKNMHDEAMQAVAELHTVRESTAEDAIAGCENYLSGLANAPKRFGAAVEELRVEYTDFTEATEQVHQEAHDATMKGGGAAVGGAAVGTSVAAMGPSALMGLATTFGTASTGTAISSLSGAAATNAAVAWLGGGAVTAGGGGMAAGSVLLAATGPVGIGVGVVALAGGGYHMNQENAKVAREATSKAVDVEADTRDLGVRCAKVEQLCSLTEKYGQGVTEQLDHLRQTSPSDYENFGDSDKQKLGALINNVQALITRLGQTIEDDA